MRKMYKYAFIVTILIVCLAYPLCTWGVTNIKIQRLYNKAETVLEDNEKIKKSELSLDKEQSEILEEECYIDDDGRVYCFDEDENCYSFTNLNVTKEKEEAILVKEDIIVGLSEALLKKLTDKDYYKLKEVMYVESTGTYYVWFVNYIDNIETNDFIDMSYTADGRLISYYISQVSFENIVIPELNESKVSEKVDKYINENGIQDEEYVESKRAYVIDGDKLYLQVLLSNSSDNNVVVEVEIDDVKK